LDRGGSIESLPGPPLAKAHQMGEDAARGLASSWPEVELMLKGIWSKENGLTWEAARAAAYAGWLAGKAALMEERTSPIAGGLERKACKYDVSNLRRECGADTCDTAGIDVTAPHVRAPSARLLSSLVGLMTARSCRGQDDS
jgi:hypothetical protein